MLIRKSALIVFVFSLLLSFGLLCSSAGASTYGERTELDPRERYQQCQRRCQWETRGEREQEQCEQSCEREYWESWKEPEERWRRSHDLNPEDPQRRYAECQQQCRQQPSQHQPQCQQRCQREFYEQERQQQERQRQLRQCQEHCQREQQGQQCQRRCQQQFPDEQQSELQPEENPEDPQSRYTKCQQQCRQQPSQHQPQCQQRCQREFHEQERQQQERQRQLRQCQEHCQREQKGHQEQQKCRRRCQQQFPEEQQNELERRPPPKHYQECRQHCQQQGLEPEQQQKCQRQCWEQDDENKKGMMEREEEEEEYEPEEERQQRNNPFYFPYRRSFQTRFREEEGRYRILQRFAQKSHVLNGIDNYRFGLYEVNPNTFVLPHHCDAESIFFVTKGNGTLTFLRDAQKESYNVERGIAVRVPAGSTVYMVNTNNRERLNVAVLALPVNTPGRAEKFFPAGTQSYLQTFSYDILEAVFNTQREKLERLFEPEQRGQQKQSQQGVFKKVQPEQIRSMSQQATSPQKGEERFAINLLKQSPIYSNQNGRFFEACPNEFKQLRHMDVSIFALNLNQQSIFVPHYSSKATFVVFVTEGKGYVEMACPHFSRKSEPSPYRKGQEEEEEEEEEEEQSTVEYKKVKARLSPGDVFVIPAGHPNIFVSSKNQNLKAIGFGIQARDNKRIFLSGEKNLIREMDRAAKEISFGVPSQQVDEVFNNPEESYFVSFNRQSQHRGSEERRGNPFSSFLDFARLF